MLKALIIDDEAPARWQVQQLLNDYEATVQVVGEAGSGKNALEAIKRTKPEVLFLDIHLPDMSGFDLLAKIEQRPFVIFTTAFSEYAIKAFETFSVDFLVKPIRKERFAKALEKLKQFSAVSPSFDYQALGQLVEQLKPKPKAFALPIKKRDRIILVDFDEIAYFKAADKYVNVHTQDGAVHLLSKSVSQLESELPSNFARVHRSIIVNRTFIYEMIKQFKGRWVLKLKDQSNSAILTGESYSKIVKEMTRI